MKPQPKPRTIRDPKYIRFVRSLPCCQCGSTQYVDSHHTKTGAIGLTGDDTSCVPLCRECHSTLHQKHAKAGYWKEDELTALLERLYVCYQMVAK